MTPGLPERLDDIAGRIYDACRSADRDPLEITLIAVTKFHPAQLIRDLVSLGLHDMGENRHQEAREKAAELADLDVTWHFVGQLQRKKAKQVREYASVIHSVDRAELVSALASEESTIGCFVQVNLTDDPDRGGARPGDVLPLAESVLEAPGLDLLGVMAVAPLDEEPARAFERLRRISDDVRTLDPRASGISAGMTHDFPEAIAAGATHLRIGTAITGNRPTRD